MDERNNQNEATSGNGPDGEPRGDVTVLLASIRAGASGAEEELFTLVYSELVRMAQGYMRRERPGGTLSATALVHEVYLRLAAAPGGASLKFDNRRHFFTAAAEAMRRILIDRARRLMSERHGGGRARVDLEAVNVSSPEQDPVQVLAIDEALGQLEVLDERAAAVVKLRCFVGITMAEIAGVLGISERLAADDWAFAKRWLRRESGLAVGLDGGKE